MAVAPVARASTLSIMETATDTCALTSSCASSRMCVARTSVADHQLLLSCPIHCVWLSGADAVARVTGTVLQLAYAGVSIACTEC